MIFGSVQRKKKRNKKAKEKNYNLLKSGEIFLIVTSVEINLGLNHAVVEEWANC